jgi:hypothetical protein
MCLHMPAKTNAKPINSRRAASARNGTRRFKVPYKPFWARIGGVDVLIRPSKDKGTIPDEVIERAFETVFGKKNKAL